MKRKGFKSLLFGALYLIVFVVWTLLIQIVDVQPVGQNGTDIGFATINCYFHKLTGVHMVIYTITDWLGLVPIFICLIFAGIGLTQLIQRKSLFRVDYDIIVLGMHYMEGATPKDINKMFEPTEEINKKYPPEGWFMEAGHPPVKAWYKIQDMAYNKNLIKEAYIGDCKVMFFDILSVVSLYEEELKRDPYGLWGLK